MNNNSSFSKNVVRNLVAGPGRNRTLRFTITTSTLGRAVGNSFGLMSMRRMRTLTKNSTDKHIREWES